MQDIRTLEYIPGGKIADTKESFIIMRLETAPTHYVGH